MSQVVRINPQSDSSGRFLSISSGDTCHLSATARLIPQTLFPNSNVLFTPVIDKDGNNKSLAPQI